MFPNTDIQTHWADTPSAAEIARSNVIAKREIDIMEKIKKKLLNIKSTVSI